MWIKCNNGVNAGGVDWWCSGLIEGRWGNGKAFVLRLWDWGRVTQIGIKCLLNSPS